jgi:hypothetical protein
MYLYLKKRMYMKCTTTWLHNEKSENIIISLGGEENLGIVYGHTIFLVIYVYHNDYEKDLLLVNPFTTQQKKKNQLCWESFQKPVILNLKIKKEIQAEISSCKRNTTEGNWSTGRRGGESMEREGWVHRLMQANWYASESSQDQSVTLGKNE